MSAVGRTSWTNRNPTWPSDLATWCRYDSIVIICALSSILREMNYALRVCSFLYFANITCSIIQCALLWVNVPNLLCVVLYGLSSEIWADARFKSTTLMTSCLRIKLFSVYSLVKESRTLAVSFLHTKLCRWFRKNSCLHSATRTTRDRNRITA